MQASATCFDPRSGLQACLDGDGELASTKAVALILHGGKENNVDPVSAHQVAVLRMVPFARHLVAAGANHGLAVWRLRFRYRGWNNAAEHPVDDVRWALRQMRIRHSGAPIVLVGHSMGGRAALRAAGEPDVAGVLALAPWLPDVERFEQVAGRRLLVLHGLRDRVTSAERSREVVRAVRPIADQAAYVAVRGSGHAMLRHVRLWNRLTTGFVLHTGLGLEPPKLVAEAFTAGELVV